MEKKEGFADYCKNYVRDHIYDHVGRVLYACDNMEICSEIMHTHGRGGYEFVTCMGVKLTLHPYAPCEL